MKTKRTKIILLVFILCGLAILFIYGVHYGLKKKIEAFANNYGYTPSIGEISLFFNKIKINNIKFKNNDSSISIDSVIIKYNINLSNHGHKEVVEVSVFADNVNLNAKHSSAFTAQIKKDDTNVTMKGMTRKIISVQNINVKTDDISIENGYFSSIDDIFYAKSMKVIKFNKSIQMQSIKININNSEVFVNDAIIKDEQTVKREEIVSNTNAMDEIKTRITASVFIKRCTYDNYGAEFNDVIIRKYKESVSFEASKIKVDNIEFFGVSFFIERKNGLYDINLNVESLTANNKKISKNSINPKNIILMTYDSEFKSPQDFDTKAGSLVINDMYFGFSVKKTNDNLDWYFEFKSTDCQKIVNSIPSTLLTTISPFRINGYASVKAIGSFNDGKSKTSLKVSNQCHITSIPNKFNTERFKSIFSHIIYDPNGKQSEFITGPGSENWTSYADINQYMTKAVLTTEDPGFYGHNGISYLAIQASIDDNINKGGFYRGASTISMQLVKNIWLMREKTISRKIQELLLVTYLEERLTKEEILELYFNVIEFGPNIYGIKNAARHYFMTSPSELTLSQSVFLASILPSPKSVYFDNDGDLKISRTNYVNLIIKMMNEKGFITDEEKEKAKEEKIKFGEHNYSSMPTPTNDTGIGIDEWN